MTPTEVKQKKIFVEKEQTVFLHEKDDVNHQETTGLLLIPFPSITF